MGLLREYVELAKDGGTTLSQWWKTEVSNWNGQ